MSAIGRGMYEIMLILISIIIIAAIIEIVLIIRYIKRPTEGNRLAFILFSLPYLPIFCYTICWGIFRDGHIISIQLIIVGVLAVVAEYYFIKMIDSKKHSKGKFK
jgi:hypothetical protein